MTDRETLKPYPFCGKQPRLTMEDATAPLPWFLVCCLPAGSFRTEAEAIAAWNRRAAPEGARAEETEPKRCPEIGPDGYQRCADYDGHVGNHTLVAPTGAPWFDPEPQVDEIEALAKKLEGIARRAAILRQEPFVNTLLLHEVIRALRSSTPHGWVVGKTPLSSGSVSLFTADQIREAIERVRGVGHELGDGSPDPFERGWWSALDDLLREFGLEETP